VRHIVFVCKGNLCRSSFAEYYLKLLLSDQTIKIESCGLDVDQGGFSPQDAVMVGKEFGVDLSMNYSKGLAACDLPNADLIVTMEYKQYRRLKNIFPENTKKIRLLGEFLPWPECLRCNIFDPYGLGPIEFRKCFRDIQRALNILKCKIDNNN
jgi:protein-tyrosine phosphatase